MSTRASRRSFLALMTLSLAAGAASADLASVRLEQLVQRADIIAVAKVDEVRKVHTTKIAFATLQEPLKGGTKRARVAFIAEGTWACDESTAVEGETVLLFLSRARPALERLPGIVPRLQEVLFEMERQGATLYTISHAGGGRMPLSKQDGKEVAQVRSGLVILPPSLAPAALDRPVPADTLLTHVRELIRREPASKGAQR